MPRGARIALGCVGGVGTQKTVKKWGEDGTPSEQSDEGRVVIFCSFLRDEAGRVESVWEPCS